MHHGVRVRVFFRRSSEHHSRNDSSRSSSTSSSYDVHVFSHIRTRYFSEGSVHNIHHVNQRSKLHTYSAEVPVLHTPVEVRVRMTCLFEHGQGKRGNVHMLAIMSVDFPDVFVFDGFI